MAHARPKRRRNLWPFDSFQKTTVYHLRGRARGVKESSTTKYKGYAIYKRADGFTVPALDRESIFEDKHEAKRFIDAMKKSNPRRKRNLQLSLPKNKFVKAKVRMKGGKIQVLVDESLLGHAGASGHVSLNPRKRKAKRKAARRRKR